MIIRNVSVMLLALSFFFVPEAFASGGISEFATPLEKVTNTITGDAGKWVAVIGMAVCGVIFIMNKEDLSGGVKLLMSVVFGIAFISGASSVVTSMFSFSGSMVA